MYSDEDKEFNKKPLMFLLLLVVFGFVCFKFTKVSISNAQTSNPANSTSSSTTVFENVSFINMTDSESASDVTPKKNTNVTGIQSTTCSVAENVYKAGSSCTISNNTVNVDGSGLVSSNAEIKLVSVSVPVILLSGKYSIKDSNRLITLSDYVYKPAGQFFTTSDVEITTAPGEIHDQVIDKVINNSIKNTAYATQYTISTDGGSGSGETTIDKYAKNDCENCANPSNTNPDLSNNSAKYLKSIYWSYANESKQKETSNLVVTANSCSNSETVALNTNSTTSCLNVWESLAGAFSSLFPSSDWTSCANGGENCVKAQDIVIKMSPIFTETNDYTQLRSKIAMDPTAAASYEPTYVVTDCTASIGGKLKGVKCYWDMSYLFDDRDFAQYKDAGGSNTPTKEQYIEYLQQESSTRTDTLYTM